MYKHKYLKYKTKYLCLKYQQSGGHYFDVPIDFESDKTWQNTGYYHPHKEGIITPNSVFEEKFKTEYFVPDYISYLNKNLFVEEKKNILKFLMEIPSFVKMGIAYMRVKSILMMLDYNPNFFEEFKTYIKTTKIPETAFKKMRLQCPDRIDSINATSLDYENFRINLQLLIIHFINYVIRYNQTPPWMNDGQIISKFISMINEYVDAYSTFNQQMIYNGSIFNFPLISNLFNSMCVFQNMLHINNEIYYSNTQIYLKKNEK
jgi:hypothetical protein